MWAVHGVFLIGGCMTSEAAGQRFRRATKTSGSLRKTIEVGVDVGPADDGAGNDVGGDGGVGRAVAAVTERDKQCGMPGTWPMIGKPVVVSPKAPAHA